MNGHGVRMHSRRDTVRLEIEPTFIDEEEFDAISVLHIKTIASWLNIERVSDKVKLVLSLV